MSTELLNKKKVWKEFIASPGVYKLTNCNCVFTFTNIVVVFINESKQEGCVDISHNIFAFENLNSIKITPAMSWFSCIQRRSLICYVKMSFLNLILWCDIHHISVYVVNHFSNNFSAKKQGREIGHCGLWKDLKGLTAAFYSCEKAKKTSLFTELFVFKRRCNLQNLKGI